MIPFKRCLIGVAIAALSGAAAADEGPVPHGVPGLDHVFLIMMENHAYGQILNNPQAPFINQYMNSANLAKKFYAVGHPSLTNYLEVVGGSNFGIHSDGDPAWHNSTCQPNIVAHTTAVDTLPLPGTLNAGVANPVGGAVCPIAGSGIDAATPALDCSGNEGDGCFINIDGHASFDAARTAGKTIADQLVAAGKSWKSYQENLPPAGADKVNYSDGVFSNIDYVYVPNPADPLSLDPKTYPPLYSAGDIVKQYAAKHNPFVYFKNVQQGTDPNNSLANTVGFDGLTGLFADLRAGEVPAFSLIAPSQCNDQHGRGNGDKTCGYDPVSTGTQSGLNPELIRRGDTTVKKLVEAIKASPAWSQGNNAIVLMWDENDYSLTPITNQVVTTVETNRGGRRVESNRFYTHFSVLKSLEAGFGLPCLNHACDDNVHVMSDLFGGNGND